MPFLSVEFCLFFLIFFPIYWLCKPKPVLQNWLLLLASGAWLYYLNPLFLYVVVGFSFVVIFFAYLISSSSKGKYYFLFSLVLILLNLIFVKYYDFFRNSLNELYGSQLIELAFPLGISYYTFQAIAYLTALYQGILTRLNWYNTLLHFSFFPTITAGPIARADRFKTIAGNALGLAEQINSITSRNVINPALAVSLIILGIAKKWWFSTTLAESLVDPIFNNPLQYDLLSLMAAIYAYTIQLFFDFSGYTDMVLGIAMLLGFQLPLNFMQPLIAYNLRDFWNRWHISLSTWIRDYIYIPLGGSAKGFVITQRNLLVAMLLSGIWHGSTWNFLIWGGLHGIVLVGLNISDKFIGRNRLTLWQVGKIKLGKLLAIVITFHFVCFSFTVFRLDTLNDVYTLYQALFSAELLMPNSTVIIALSLFIIGLSFYRLWLFFFQQFVKFLNMIPTLFWAVPITLLIVIIIIFSPSGIPGFIYAGF